MQPVNEFPRRGQVLKRGQIGQAGRDGAGQIVVMQMQQVDHPAAGVHRQPVPFTDRSVTEPVGAVGPMVASRAMENIDQSDQAGKSASDGP